MIRVYRSKGIADTVVRFLIIVVMLIGLFGLLSYLFTGPASSDTLRTRGGVNGGVSSATAGCDPAPHEPKPHWLAMGHWS